MSEKSRVYPKREGQDAERSMQFYTSQGLDPVTGARDEPEVVAKDIDVIERISVEAAIDHGLPLPVDLLGSIHAARAVASSVDAELEESLGAEFELLDSAEGTPPPPTGN